MAVESLPPAIAPDPSFRKRVEQMSGEKVSSCFQCEKCTNGCPVTFSMDIVPHKLMRLVHLGAKNEVLNSDTIWVCASCETCSTRCPNGIDIAHLIDTLRQIALHDSVKASQENVPVFHSAFLSSIKLHGRVSESEMTVAYMLRSEGIRGLLKQAGLGLAMFKKGKLKILPAKLFAGSQVRRLFSIAERKV